jgi:hypothetical protein
MMTMVMMMIIIIIIVVLVFLHVLVFLRVLAFLQPINCKNHHLAIFFFLQDQKKTQVASLDEGKAGHGFWMQLTHKGGNVVEVAPLWMEGTLSREVEHRWNII